MVYRTPAGILVDGGGDMRMLYDADQSAQQDLATQLGSG